MAQSFLDNITGLPTLWSAITSRFVSKTGDEMTGLLKAPEVQTDKVFISRKTYTGIYGSANDAANASFYFATVMPDDFYKHWHVKYRITAVVPEQANYNGFSEVDFYGAGGLSTTYSCFNSHYNTSYRTYYFHNLYMANRTGFNNGYGHALGIGLRGSANPASSSYPRTFTVEIIEADNCTVTMLDAMVKYANLPGTGSTNYGGFYERNGCDNGLQESGDSNSYDRLQLNSIRLYAGTYGIFGRTLIMEDATGKYQSVCTSYSTDTTKTYNPEGFRPEKLFYFYDSNSYAVTDGNLMSRASYVYSAFPPFDVRFSLNCGSTLTPNKPLYLVGQIKDDGLFYLKADGAYSQELPTTEDGYVYLYVGEVNTTYNASLSPTHPMYWYKDGRIREYKEVFSEARFSIDIETGHLFAQMSGNIEFTLDEQGHLISEVT